jgi:hypothetical protein
MKVKGLKVPIEMMSNDTIAGTAGRDGGFAG